MADTEGAGISATPAEELRQAAKGLREDDFIPAEDFFHAVADWLDAEVATVDAWGGDPAVLRAVTVARAYLGTSPEPAAEEER